MTAKDVFGNVATGYRGTIQFTSSDGSGDTPRRTTPSRRPTTGRTLRRDAQVGGTQSITGTDTTTSSITGSQSGITVIPAAAASFTFAGVPASVTAGTAQDHHVDGEGRVRQHRDRLHGHRALHEQRRSGGASRQLHIHRGDAGVHTFSVTLNTPGSQSITATDTAVGTITGNVSTTRHFGGGHALPGVGAGDDDRRFVVHRDRHGD